MIGQALVPCNWLQIMENSLDPVHTEWLHGHLQEFVEEQRDGIKPSYAISRHHLNIAFEEFEYGIYKRRSDGGPVGGLRRLARRPPGPLPEHPGGRQRRRLVEDVRVPDARPDRRRAHDALLVHRLRAAAGARVPAKLLDEVPLYDVPCRNEAGEFHLDIIDAQDVMAWVTQGPIAQRELEKLGTTDRGVILFRKILARELAKVARGEDPIGVIRDPHEIIDLPVEHGKDMFTDGFASLFRRMHRATIRYADELLELFEGAGPAHAEPSTQRIAELVGAD